MLALIHGFLGQKEDWNEVIQHLPKDISVTAINLPGHSGLPINKDFLLSIKNTLKKAKFLVGYSAGGRIALQLKQYFPEDFERLILISTHPGLTDSKQRQQRWELDLAWIKKLETSSLEEFLNEWYAQPIFNTLRANTKLFAQILKRRKTQNPQKLAAFLKMFSLGKIPNAAIPENTLFICGDQDLKYVSLYHTLPPCMKVYTVTNAGHAVHLENPQRCAEIIKGLSDSL